MNSELKVPSCGTVIPYDAPFKVLSEKQLEWIQFKAKQKILELKEEEEWRKYCQEQNFNDVDFGDNIRENPSNADDLPNKVAEKIVKPVSTEATMDHKMKTKDTRKPTVRSNKGKEMQCESTPPIQPSHFQKTRIESPFNFPAPGKLNVLKVQKWGSDDRANAGNFDGEDKGNAPQYRVPVRQRTVKAVDLPDLEYDDLPRALSEILLYPKVNKNSGFSLPYSLKQQQYLALKAYLPSFPKPSIHRKKIPVSSGATGIATYKRNPTGATVSGRINPKFQNPSTSKAKDSKSQEKINTNSEKENLKLKTKSVPAKQKKLSKRQKDASNKVAEFVLHEILDEVFSKVEREEEEKRKRFIFGQLNNVLQKLNDIESEEAAIHRKWETFIIEKPQAKDMSIILSPSTPIELPKPSDAVQEKFAQSTVDVIFREALKRSEANIHSVNSEITTNMRIPSHQNSTVNEHLTEDVNVFQHHPTEQNLRLIEADKQTTAVTETSDLLNFKSEREIGVSSESLKRIYNYKKGFRLYLKHSSQISRQHCEFWNISTETADQILEECLQEVAEELREIPSSLIVDLYNQEFEHSYVHS